MTDHDHHLDDLASAYLDGLTTPDETARVESDPALVARVQRLREVRTAVRTDDPQPIDEARRDAAIAAARRAFDEPATVTPITSARRWPASRRTLAVIGVAAAIALVALVVPLLDRLDPDTADQSGSEEAATALDAARDDTAVAGSGDAAVPSAPGAASDLGRFRDLDDLAAAVRVAIDHPRPEPVDPPASTVGPGTMASEGAGGCPETDGGGLPLYRALAELDGRPVIASVHAGDDAGARELVVLDQADCSVVARTPL